MEEKKEVNPIDKLFDENNTDPIVMYNEKGEPVSFEQIAIIPYDDRIFAILKPTEKTEGVGDDEALAFEVMGNEADGDEEYLSLVSDMAVIDNIFKIYNKLIDEDEAKRKGNKK